VLRNENFRLEGEKIKVVNMKVIGSLIEDPLMTTGGFS